MPYYCSATELVTVTATDDTHLFYGFGANISQLYSSYNKRSDNHLSDEAKDVLDKIIWEDLNLASVRIFNTAWSEDSVIIEYTKDRLLHLLKYVNSKNTVLQQRYGIEPYDLDIITTWANEWTPEHAPRIAELISKLEKSIRDTARILTNNENYEFQIKYTEWGNEPNQTHSGGAVPVPSEESNLIVKECRTALDDSNLTHTRLIGPGSSNCDNYMESSIESILNDEDASSSLYGFSFHAYNMSLTHRIATRLIDAGYPLLQTESCVPEGDVDWNIADSQAAVQTWTKALCDINLGTNIWQYFMDIGTYDAGTPGCYLISINPENGDIIPYLKFFYFRALARTLVPGTSMYKCTTDITAPTEYIDEDSDRYKYMEYTYQGKPPVAAAVGKRPDGTWAIAATNHTRLSNLEIYNSTYFPADDYQITFIIPQLEKETQIPFLVWRVNNSSVKNDTWLNIDTVMMENGKVSITLHHCDLVCLSQEFDTKFTEIPKQVQLSAKSPYFPYNAGYNELLPSRGSSIALYDLAGQRIALKCVTDANAFNSSVISKIASLKKKLSPGTYLISYLTDNQIINTRRLVIIR
jgi:hypothetical protein